MCESVSGRMSDTLARILLIAPIFLFSMVAHEYAHGYAALKQGDDTAKSLGRLTWNPLKHIDPFMTILLPIMMLIGSQGRMALGGAKPVPVNPRLYRNYVSGDIIVSLAGVASNLIIAVLCVPVLIGFGLLAKTAPAVSAPVSLLQAMLQYGVLLNLGLAAFNLIPIPPLDGSHVAKHLMPLRMALAYQRLMRWGILLIVGLLWFAPGVITWWMTPVYWLFEIAMTTTLPYVIPGRFTLGTG
jgi:Zn-dependent protease